MCVENFTKKTRLGQPKRFLKVFRAYHGSDKLYSIGNYARIVDDTGRLIRGNMKHVPFQMRRSFQVFLDFKTANRFAVEMNIVANKDEYFIVKEVEAPAGALVWYGEIQGAANRVDGCKGARISSGRLA